ncbi:hypothetical protein CHCC14568_0139 [Bacillus licheniformis]|nr:hypothetical protein CHCC14568_0139 [Bacillus licheniformis]TWN51339.1 hypothetical protein CHCC14437_3238 [Bacillus licheniformis]
MANQDNRENSGFSSGFPNLIFPIGLKIKKMLNATNRETTNK